MEEVPSESVSIASEISSTPRFNCEHDRRLLDLCQERLKVLEGGGKTSEINKKKGAAWTEIARIINSEKRTNFEPEQCRRRFQNLKAQSKNANAKHTKSRRLTGGGKNEVPPLTETQEAVIGLYGNTRGFKASRTLLNHLCLAKVTVLLWRNPIAPNWILFTLLLLLAERSWRTLTF